MEAKYLYATASPGRPYQLGAVSLVALAVEPTPAGGLTPVDVDRLHALGDVGMAHWLQQQDAYLRRQSSAWHGHEFPLTDPARIYPLRMQRPRRPRVMWHESNHVPSAIVVPIGSIVWAASPFRGDHSAATSQPPTNSRARCWEERRTTETTADTPHHQAPPALVRYA